MSDPFSGYGYESTPWARDESPWNENILISSWAEMGSQSISVEGLYQAFKERLLHELAIKERHEELDP